MDKLTVGDADRTALMGMGGNSHDNICSLAKQLADTMRENERLREILSYLENWIPVKSD